MTTAAVKDTAKKASSKLVKFAAGGAGFGVGLLGMGKLQGFAAKLPAFIPEFIRKMVPGVAVMILSYYASTRLKDDRLQALAMGVGFSGGADALRRLLGSIFPGVKDMVPGLDGPQGAAPVNVGDFQMPYYWQNAFQGLNGSFSMQGLNGSFSMQGADPAYALNGGAFALNGGSYSLMGRKRRKSLAGPAYALN